MLILKKLKLNNFLSHENTTINFTPDQKLLIDGVSGAGKSGIVEALVWGLYGRGRSDNRSLIKYEKNSARVSITLEDTNLKDFVGYKVERNITKAGLHNMNVFEVKADGSFTPVKVSGLKNIQEHLEKNILHSSYLLFINSIAHPQDNVESFVKQTASRRKDIILEIINASDYDEYYDKTRDKINELNNSLISSQTKKLSLNESIKENKEKSKQLEALKKEEVKIHVDVVTLEKNLKIAKKALDRVNAIAIIYTERNNQKMNLETNINELEKKLEDELEKLSKYSEPIIEKSKEKIKNLGQNKTELKSLNNLVQEASEWHKETYKLIQEKPVDLDYDKDIAALNAQIINVMTEDVEICSVIKEKCPLIINKKQERIKYFEDQLQYKVKEKDQYLKAQESYLENIGKLGECPIVDKQKIESLEKEISEQEQIKEKLKESDIMKKSIDININHIKQDIVNAKKEIAKLILEMLKGEKEIANQEKLRREEYNLDTELTKFQIIREENTRELTLAKDAQSKVDADIERLKVVENEQKEVIYDVESLELLKNAFGPNGIKAIVIDYVIPRLEEKINNILSQLSDFRIRLDTQKRGIGKDTTLEGLFISIFNELGEEFNFDNYSGGERLKIIVAISEALSEIQNIGFRVLDELFIGLDEESTEKFVEVMTTLQERFNQLICISHLRNIKDMFDETLMITKVNGVSLAR